MLSPTQSPQDGRKRVLIVFSDDDLKDKDQYGKTKTALAAQGVVMFGVAVRSGPTKTPADTAAENALKTVVDDNQADAIKSLQIDAIRQYLDGICDPDQTWGKYVGKKADNSAGSPCPSFTEQNDCNGDMKPTCEGDTPNKCVWDDATHTCSKKKLCDIGQKDQCNQDPDCKWDDATDKCNPPICRHSTEIGCLADPDTCVWDNIDQSCGEKPCNYPIAECEVKGAPNCTVKNETCQPKRCLYPEKKDCEEDPYCEWERKDGIPKGPCVQKPCTEYEGELECNKVEDCEWDTKAPPGICNQKYCPKTYTEAIPCDADTECTWDAAKKKCVPKNCNDIDDACECKSDPDCFWQVSSANPKMAAKCKDSKFGECPTLDIII
eukprot:gene21507-21030_t